MSMLLNGSCPEGFDAEDRNVGRQLKSLGRTAPIAHHEWQANFSTGQSETGSDLGAGLALELSNARISLARLTP